MVIISNNNLFNQFKKKCKMTVKCNKWLFKEEFKKKSTNMAKKYVIYGSFDPYFQNPHRHKKFMGGFENRGQNCHI